MFPGNFAQRGSHGRWADAVSLSERRISHCKTHSECYTPLHSLYPVLDANYNSHSDTDMTTLI